MKTNLKTMLGLGGVSIAAMMMASTAMAQDSIPMGTGADMAGICGDKPTIVALVDGFGGDTWRKIALAELKDELEPCTNVTEVLYADGAGDPAKTNSDINSLTAQGVNVMVIFPDFGPAMIPAIRSATQAGVVTVPYNVNLGGTAGVDYTANVTQDFAAASEKWAKWMNDNVGEGNILYFSGPAGNGFSQNFMDGIKAAIEPYPGLNLLQDTHVATNWNPADAQKATAGVIAQYGKIDAIMSDFGPVTIAVIRAFEQAGLEVPAVVSLASNNELNCMYMEAKEAGKAWPYITLEGTTTQVRNAVRRGMAEYQGTENSDPLGMVASIFADSGAGIDPKCDPNAPLDADLSGLLSDEQMQEVFNQ